jgi:CHAT domain-containing protein
MVLQCRGVSDSDFVADPLSVGDISQLRVDNARIAFLSACSTAKNNAQAPLADEVIHLASAFQVAGFPHVIGSL